MALSGCVDERLFWSVKWNGLKQMKCAVMMHDFGEYIRRKAFWFIGGLKLSRTELELFATALDEACLPPC